MGDRPSKFIELADTEDWWDEYLEVLAQTGEYTQAAYRVQADPRAVRKYRQDNPEFGAMCDWAKDQFAQKLRDAAFNRAVNGVDRCALGGKERDMVIPLHKEFSDRLLELYLKRSDPTFQDRHHVEVSADADLQGAFDYASLSPAARKLARALMEQIKADEAEKQVSAENPAD